MPGKTVVACRDEAWSSLPVGSACCNPVKLHTITSGILMGRFCLALVVVADTFR